MVLLVIIEYLTTQPRIAEKGTPMSTTFKKREKFDIHAKITELNLDPRIADVLEHTRPLTNASLLKVNNRIDYIVESIDTIKERLNTTKRGFWFACGVEFAGFLMDKWTFAVVRGATYLMYTGKYTEQDVYSVLCLAAGSCLRAPDAEAFRVVLSLVTKAGLRPSQHDRSPLINVGISPAPKKWHDLANTYGSLEEVKGSKIVECLAIGIGCHLGDGKATRKEASRLFKNSAPWRASSPIPQLLRGETRC
jgi:hypothetical protein